MMTNMFFLFFRGMNNSMLYRVFLSLLLLFVTLFTLSGCEQETAPADVTVSQTYKVIYNGIEVTSGNSPGNYASFYIPPEMVTRYGYEQLTPGDKKIYDAARFDIGNFNETVLLDSDTDGARYTKILDLLRIEELSYTHLYSRKLGDFDTSEAKYQVNFKYLLSPDEMTKRNLESEKAAKDILLAMPDGLDDFGKVKYIHDWLILNVDKNTTDNDALTIYGALIRGIANCEGYSRSFSFLANLCGIENLVITGLTDTGHMWNMVKLGGNWYHLDVTFDEPEESLAAKYPDFISYQHFLVSDSLIRNDRIVWTNLFIPPAANAVNENYFVKENKLIESDDTAKTIIENAVFEAVSEGKTYVSVKCASTDVYLRTVENLSADFDSISASVEEKTGKKPFYSTSTIYGNYRIICFFMSYPETP
jgi:hypothetical protein